MKSLRHNAQFLGKLQMKNVWRHNHAPTVISDFEVNDLECEFIMCVSEFYRNGFQEVESEIPTIVVVLRWLGYSTVNYRIWLISLVIYDENCYSSRKKFEQRERVGLQSGHSTEDFLDSDLLFLLTIYDFHNEFDQYNSPNYTICIINNRL